MIGYLRGEAFAVAAPGGVEVHEEEINGGDRRLKVALVQLHHAPVPGDLEPRGLPFAARQASRQHKSESDERQQPA